MRDLEPATRRLADLLARISDDQLHAPTPCERYRLGDLVEHVNGVAVGFTAAARKDLGPITAEAPDADASRLPDDWRAQIPQRLDTLVEAWRDPAAWEGMTQIGGIDLPGGAAGTVALGELVIHGWDIARATAQPFDADPESLAGCMEYVSMFEGVEHGPFGPAVEVGADAPMLDRVLGLSGRDPNWAPR